MTVYWRAKFDRANWLPKVGLVNFWTSMRLGRLFQIATSRFKGPSSRHVFPFFEARDEFRVLPLPLLS